MLKALRSVGALKAVEGFPSVVVVVVEFNVAVVF